jgi:hypothetical protein
VLLDSATGEPYKGVTADAVSLSPGSVVVQFRKAVQLKNSSILTGLSASQLLVYKNKAAFDKRNAEEEKEEPLDPTESLGLLGSKEDMLVVVVPSSPTRYPELDEIHQEIKALENSEEYKTLAHKNRPWALPEPTEQEKGEWQLLKEKLAYLKKKEDFHQEAILSTKAHSVKKSDKTRKEYKKDTAIKDERLLLSDVATKMWDRFRFNCSFEDGPSFGDLKRASGFGNCMDVRNYFANRENGQVKEDEIKDSLTKEEWILLIRLNQHVNHLLHGTLIENENGSLRLVMEHDFFEGGRKVAENLVLKLYGSSKEVDIKDASDSSTSP